MKNDNNTKVQNHFKCVLYVTGTIPFIFYNTKIAKQSLKLKIEACTI